MYTLHIEFFCSHMRSYLCFAICFGINCCHKVPVAASLKQILLRLMFLCNELILGDHKNAPLSSRLHAFNCPEI